MLSLLSGVEMSLSVRFTFGRLVVKTKSELFHSVPNSKSLECKHEKQKARDYFFITTNHNLSGIERPITS